MEKFIRYGFDAEKIPFYDCSIMNKTEEQWYEEGQSSILIGAACIAYGLIIEILYVLVITVMWKLQKETACYKIMIFLGLFDMAGTIIASLVSGYLWLFGGCFCTNPNLIYIAGSWGLALWCGACFACLILVINRLCDIWSKTLAETMFSGWKMFVWLSIPVVYTLYFLIYTPPVLFNSNLEAWFFSPMITKTEEETQMFYNFPHTFNNLLVVALVCTLYIILSLVISHKYGGMGNISKLQRSIIIQACLICMANLAGSLIYVYMNFFPTPKFLVLVGHFCWMAAHGIPAFVYILLNKTVQTKVFALLHIPNKYRVSTTIVKSLPAVRTEGTF